jgi:hypothetical protein
LRQASPPVAAERRETPLLSTRRRGARVFRNQTRDHAFPYRIEARPFERDPRLRDGGALMEGQRIIAIGGSAGAIDAIRTLCGPSPPIFRRRSAS